MAGYVRLLKNPAFTQLFVSQFVSLVGTSAFRVALIWYVAERLDAPGALGLVLAALTAPQLLVSLGAGVLGDRYNRKWIAIISDIASGLTFLGVWLVAIRGEPGLALLVSMVLLAGISTAVYGPVASAILPLVVRRSQLRLANSLQAIGGQGAFVVGPAIAGLAIGAVGVEPFFLLNAVSFFVSAAVLLPARVSSPTVATLPEERSGSIGGIRRGLTMVLRSSWMRSGIVAGALANLLLVAPLAVLVPLMIERDGLGPATLGGFTSAQAAGIVLGAALAPYAVPRAGSSLSAALAGLGLAALACLGFLLPLGHWGLIAVGGTVCICLALFDVLWDSYLQAHAPAAYLTRIVATDAWLSFSLRSLGLISASLAGLWVGLERAIGIQAVVFVLALAPLAFPHILRQEDPSASHR